MAYIPRDWNPGDIITEARIDNLETQFQEIKNLFDAFSILAADVDNTPVALTLAASTMVARLGAGIVAATPTQIMAILTGTAGADFSMNSKRLTNILAPNAAGCALIKGTRVTLAELPVLTTGKVWEGVGGVPAETSPTKSASGTYTGDGNTNRAIPHGLGITPKIVLIYGIHAAGNVPTLHRITVGLAAIVAVNSGNEYEVAVTAMTSTNFYVGDAAGDLGNWDTHSYYWVAIG